MWNFSDGLKKCAAISLACLLSSCALVQYRPLQTIDQIDVNKGYRLEKALSRRAEDDTFVVLIFSGGGTRAAALGYGVLEELKKQQVNIGGKQKSLLDNVDMVYGVSGGSVLAAYFSMHGAETVPAFERRFLKQNFQRQFTKQLFSLANVPRLTSPEYGRGDLLQEQFENTLFRDATFGDLDRNRKGPFAVISATDMAAGSRLDFTQEYFDMMCLDLSQMRIARAVAASSAVPLVFSPITLNNNGGKCGYAVPEEVRKAAAESSKGLQRQTQREFVQSYLQYNDSTKRPYIHLLDGGLTDNLGLRGLLDVADARSSSMLQRQLADERIRRIVIINVNAQNKISSSIDQSAAVPGLADVVSAIIDIPIDKYSQESLRRFRAFADQWNESTRTGRNRNQTGMYFVSLNLRELPESQLRKNVLNIPTTFYLPPNDINDLKSAARALLQQSTEYKRLLADLSVEPVVGTEPVLNKPVWFVGEGPQLPQSEAPAGYDLESLRTP
ncbi:MAG: patatin-like phospholipase family protein [Neisseria zoodegmatis]|uniref:patatin-like phospholipase family protein n=1 Tax=Neisseria zoodegmatis TaxID=326523 RepID=UPI0026EE5FBF|nr:patatin-like phospholipase family protein [Neisseria zoodegmatis]MDO5069716.1 patatin-like phospholipase family protein [Neisseria zoodegmatis]